MFLLVPTTAAPPGKTTTPPMDCIYDVTPEELEKDEPVVFADGITADLTPEGTIVYEFPEPRDVIEVNVQAPDGTDLVVVPVFDDGKEGKPTTVNSKPDEPITTPVNEKDVKKVIIKKPDDSPLTPTDITVVEVNACAEGGNFDCYSD